MKDLLGCVMDIGEQMLLCGAEVHRVEDSVKRMCTALGAAQVDIFIITSSMVATVQIDDDTTYTQSRRVENVGTDIEKLHKLNNLSRAICKKPMTAAEIQTELSNISLTTKRYPFWIECISYAIIAGSFTLFFGGNWIEALLSLLIGALIRFVVSLTENMLGNKILAKCLCSFSASALAFLCLRIGWVDSVDMIIVGNIMTLIPGIGLTNAVRDLFTGDSIAGLLRSIEAVLVALAIAAGYFLFIFLTGGVAA